VAIPRRWCTSGHPDPRESLAGAPRLDLRRPGAWRTSAATCPRAQWQPSPPDLDAGLPASRVRRPEPSVSTTSTPSRFCARYPGTWAAPMARTPVAGGTHRSSAVADFLQRNTALHEPDFGLFVPCAHTRTPLHPEPSPERHASSKPAISATQTRRRHRSRRPEHPQAQFSPQVDYACCADPSRPKLRPI